MSGVRRAQATNSVPPNAPAVPGPGALADVLRHMPAMVLALDGADTITFWSEECERVLGFNARSAVGARGFLARLIPDPAERARLTGWWRSVGTPHRTYEAKLRDAGGEARTVSWARLDLGAHPPAPGAWAVGHDITVHDRTERELRDSREYLRTAFENVPVEFWAMDAQGRYSMVNPAAAKRWGNNIGKTLQQTGAPPDVRKHWRAVNARAFAGELVRGEIDYPVGNTVRTYEHMAAPIRRSDGTVSGILGVNIDITDRKAAELALRQSERTQSAILSALPDLMFRMSADGRYLDYRSPPGIALLVPPEEFLGRSADDVLPKEHAERCMECIRSTLSEGGVHHYEYSLPTDPERHFEVRMSACGNGEVIALVRNISEVKLAERSVRESEARFRTLFESSPIGIFVIQDGRLAMVNSVGLSILNAPSPADILGRNVMDFVAEEDRSAAAGCVATAIREGRSPPRLERLLRLDGSHVTVEAAGSRIQLGGNPAVQVMIQDVTQRLRNQAALREADDQLRQAQKMEALGQLAAGVAHDFNNLLTAIFGYVSLARSSLEESSPAWTALDGVQAAAEQASDVVRSLLTVSQKAVTEFKPVDLRRVAAGALSILRAGLPASITITHDDDAHPVWVLGDVSLLKQVVLNLALNARDAMPKGGTLRVTVRPASGPDNLASLRVEDTGIGITPELRPRIFEPFFTTKSRDTRSGLGLSIAQGIVRSHSGRIDVESTPGRGSAFTVLLPALASGPAPTEQPPRQSGVGNGERVLVVDDSRQVREVIGSALTREGFGVHYAAGLDGLSRTLGQRDPQIQLVIINLDMPHKAGADCARRALKLSPGIRLIALTAGLRTRAGLPASVRVVRKPFQVAQIAELAGHILRQHPPRAHRTKKKAKP